VVEVTIFHPFDLGSKLIGRNIYASSQYLRTRGGWARCGTSRQQPRAGHLKSGSRQRPPPRARLEQHHLVQPQLKAHHQLESWTRVLQLVAVHRHPLPTVQPNK
ncbi:UNVERIFIED_CONTAM: hypothetical protein Sindi_2424700, partial [Sesamum indicum]